MVERMNHWDLIPGETVTLVRAGQGVRAGFAFRDTLHAFFVVDEGGTVELRLREDGNLEEHVRELIDYDVPTVITRTRIWRIAEERANTRGQC
jgi:hypothetical protein